MSTQLFVGLALVVGAPALKPGPKAPDPPSLVGEWAVESWVMDGEADPCAGRTMTFVKDGVFVAQQDGEPQGAGRFQCTPGAVPGEIDMTEDGMAGPYKGIWKLAGDTLTLCVSGDPKAGRPTVFAAPAGSERVLVTLRRVPRKP